MRKSSRKLRGGVSRCEIRHILYKAHIIFGKIFQGPDWQLYVKHRQIY